MGRLIIFFILFSTCAFGQRSDLYSVDRKLIADTTFQIDEDSYNNVLTMEKVLLPRMFNRIIYPEIARETAIEGKVIVQVFVDQKDFKYKIVKSDNDYLKVPVIDYFDHLDKYVIDQIRPSKGIFNIYIPIEFKIQKDQFSENLRKYNSLTIETKDIAKQTDIIKH
jgi:hypothetical protein